MFWAIWLEDAVKNFRIWGFFALQYFTAWGVWMTTAYFTFATITHLRYRKKEQGLKDSESPWCAWKCLSALFKTALLWECVIASVYWPTMYPADRRTHMNDFKWNFANACDHLLPICVLFTDWLLNRIYYEWNQIYANLGVFVLYGIVNISVTLLSGKPVYSMMSWDSVGSVMIALAIFPLATVYYIGLYYLTRFKFRKM